MNKSSELHGVMFYFDNFEVVHHLTDEEAGQLFKNIASYACGIEPADLGGALMSLFCMFKIQIDRNRNKYEELCKKNREKAQMRWSKFKQVTTSTEADNAILSNSMQPHTDECLTNHNNNSNTSNNINVANASIIECGMDSGTDEDLSFEKLWNMYGKKEGNEVELRHLWGVLSLEDKKRVVEFVPEYVKTTPEIRYRKYLSNFLRQRTWESYSLNTIGNGTNNSNNFANEIKRTANQYDRIAIMQQFITDSEISSEQK